MALLDFSRFGISINENFDYILGLDLGHGEVSVAYRRLSGNLASIVPQDLVLETIHSNTKVLSALGKDKNGWKLLSPSMPIPYNMKLYYGFKKKPSILKAGARYPGETITYKELIQEFTNILFTSIKNASDAKPDIDLSGFGLLAVGCPSSSEWFKKNENDQEWDVEYKNIISKAIQNCGLNLKVVIIPESRASLLKVYKQNIANSQNEETIKDKLRKGILVFDFGSSTLDSTSINIDTNQQTDDSIPLGASLIEEKIISLVGSHYELRRDQFNDINKAELDTRAAKENFFNNGSTRVNYELDHDDEVSCKLVSKIDPNSRAFQITMDDIVNNETVSYNNDEGEFVGSWKELAENFIIASKEKWEIANNETDFEGLLLLTGGASRMPFIRGIMDNLFPNAMIQQDQDPSYCVSQGLVWAAGADMEAWKLLDNIIHEIDTKISIHIESFRKSACEKLTEYIYECFISEADKWKKEGDGVTIRQMTKAVTEDLKCHHIDHFMSIIRESLNKYMNDTEENSLKNEISNIVLATYEKIYPGNLDAKMLEILKIDDEKWKSECEKLATIDFDAVNIVDSLDLSNAFKTAMIFFLFIPLLTIRFILGVIDWCAGSNIGDALDRFITNDVDKKFNCEERKKYYIRIINKEEKTKKAICKVLEKSFMPQESVERESVCAIIRGIVHPVVESSINHVSLYF